MTSLAPGTDNYPTANYVRGAIGLVKTFQIWNPTFDGDVVLLHSSVHDFPICAHLLGSILECVPVLFESYKNNFAICTLRQCMLERFPSLLHCFEDNFSVAPQFVIETEESFSILFHNLKCNPSILSHRIGREFESLPVL